MLSGEMALVLLYIVFASVLELASSSSFYYKDRPLVTIQATSLRLPVVGEYVFNYASRRDIDRADLYIIEDAFFGCDSDASASNYSLPGKDSYFVVMVPFLGNRSPCSEYHKAATASKAFGAAGIIYYYTPDDPQGGRLPNRPTNSPFLQRFSATKIELVSRKLAALLSEAEKEGGMRVTVSTYSHPLQTTQTFYFIVFAFCILMLLSCLWFVMSYIKRCHYSIRRRQRRVRNGANSSSSLCAISVDIISRTNTKFCGLYRFFFLFFFTISCMYLC